MDHSHGRVTSSTLPKTSGSNVHEPFASRPCMPHIFRCLLHSCRGESRVSGTISDPGVWFFKDREFEKGEQSAFERFAPGLRPHLSNNGTHGREDSQARAHRCVSRSKRAQVITAMVDVNSSCRNARQTSLPASRLMWRGGTSFPRRGSSRTPSSPSSLPRESRAQRDRVPK